MKRFCIQQISRPLTLSIPTVLSGARPEFPAVPSVLMGNVRSLPNKMYELSALVKTQRNYTMSSILCFTETWLHTDISDHSVSIPGFKTLRADRDTVLSSKTKGGGIAVYVNERWCSPAHITVMGRVCTPNIELLAVEMRPYGLSREFTSVIFVGVYILPSTRKTTDHKDEALNIISKTVTMQQMKYPRALIVISGDFNHVTLETVLPTFDQFVKCPTRENITLDLLYANSKDAYSSTALPPLGRSDHNLVLLTPAAKRQPISMRTTCFGTTNGDMLCQPHRNDIDSMTDCITDDINICEDTAIPTRTVRCYPYNELMITSQLKDLLHKKKQAFDSGDRDDLKRIQGQIKAYCRILYLKPKMQIVVRGQNVKSQLIAKSLAYTRKDHYKPTFLNKRIPITFGYNTKSKDQYGIMMYHKNRLIKAYERVGCQLKANNMGVGVIGIVECDFLDPAHNKQSFMETEKYRKTITNLGIKLEEYWKEIRYRKKIDDPNSTIPVEDTMKRPDQAWVQCNDCLKWRKLPDGIDKNELACVWFCHMNPDPQFRSCYVDEEPEDSDDEQTSYKKTYKQEERKKRQKKRQTTFYSPPTSISARAESSLLSSSTISQAAYGPSSSVPIVFEGGPLSDSPLGQKRSQPGAPQTVKRPRVDSCPDTPSSVDKRPLIPQSVPHVSGMFPSPSLLQGVDSQNQTKGKEGVPLNTCSEEQSSGLNVRSTEHRLLKQESSENTLTDVCDRNQDRLLMIKQYTALEKKLKEEIHELQSQLEEIQNRRKDQTYPAEAGRFE